MLRMMAHGAIGQHAAAWTGFEFLACMDLGKSLCWVSVPSNGLCEVKGVCGRGHTRDIDLGSCLGCGAWKNASLTLSSEKPESLHTLKSSYTQQG